MHEECVEYNKNHILTECTDIILEAKRVLLNEDIDQIASITLNEKTVNYNTKECRQSLNWNDPLFWENLPNPRNKTEKTKPKCEEIPFKITDSTKTILDKISDLEQKAKVVLRKKSKISKDNKILRTYFEKWRFMVARVKEKRKLEEESLIKQQKLEAFLNNYAKFKKNQEKQKNNSLHSPKRLTRSRSSDYDSRSETNESMRTSNVMKTKSAKVEKSNYKNRFQAQKKIIEAQKEKLQAQNRLIDELRLGIIKEELIKSIDCTKVDIREIFSKCSTKVKLKIMPHLENIEAERELFYVNTQKAPKIVQQMEKRAIERALKREIILERKRLIEEQKKKLAEEAIEKKRMQDEEERKHNMETLKERRRKELELERIRQQNKQVFLEKWNTASLHYDKKQLKNTFGTLKNNYITARHNNFKSVTYYQNKILKDAMASWKHLVEDKYNIKYEIADKLYNRKILKFYFTSWKETRTESIRSMQVAEDFYDFRLQNNTFVHWHRYVCTEIVFTEKKMLKAVSHYSRRILFQYFYQWRSLPAVIQLEKAKEEKKRKWREKVWEILPDYNPPVED